MSRQGLPLLCATLSSRRADDSPWRDLAEKLLEALLQPLEANADAAGATGAAGASRGGGLSEGVLSPRPFDAGGGGRVEALLRTLLHRCCGAEAATTLTAAAAARQLRLLERVLGVCSLEARLWLLPALLRPPCPPQPDCSDEPLSFGGAIVVQRLLLRCCSAAIRQLKADPRSDTPGAAAQRQTLAARVVGLHGTVEYCLAGAARGGLCAGVVADGGFDCVRFVQAADMMIGALSLLRLLTSFAQWQHTQDQQADEAAQPKEAAEEGRLSRQQALRSADARKSFAQDVLAPLRLRVETYVSALSRLESAADSRGGDAGPTPMERLGLEGEEGVAQACTTLQMLLQAVEAAEAALALDC